jgi:hypothetical protein
MYRVLYWSTRGHHYLVGNPTVHPVDPPVPDGVGTTFPTIDAAQAWSLSDDGPASITYRIDIIDAAGALVRMGHRNGLNGTGKRWMWRDETVR